MPYSLNRWRLHLKAYMKWCLNLMVRFVLSWDTRSSSRSTDSMFRSLRPRGDRFGERNHCVTFLGCCFSELSLAYFVFGYCASLSMPFVFKEWWEGKCLFYSLFLRSSVLNLSSSVDLICSILPSALAPLHNCSERNTVHCVGQLKWFRNVWNPALLLETSVGK